MPKGVYPRGVIIRKPHSPETRAKQSLSALGKPKSEEHRKNVSKAKTGAKYPNRKKYFKGITKTERDCAHCGEKMIITCYTQQKKFCSLSCSSKSRPSGRTGKKNSEEQKAMMRAKRGELHPRWIKDRTQIKDEHKDRGGQFHREWSIQVKSRDKWKCKIGNSDCLGRLESHHILSWKDYPELRYEVSNGITLCHLHHPRKKEDELKLSSHFAQLLKSV